MENIMGLVQAAVGSIGGSLADQWKDFYTVPDGLPPTAALFAAVPGNGIFKRHRTPQEWA